MALNCGIVGLPNVGKSTIFSALTSSEAEAANYPFCTIDPNVGIVSIPDKRLDKIAEIIPPKKKIPAVVEFVDIAGLVSGASKGEGLGNRFLSHIREVGAIIHVVRCFDNGDIIHVNNKIDPQNDIEVINTELALADLETVEKRYEKTLRQAKIGGKEKGAKLKIEVELLQRLQEALGKLIPARALEYSDEEKEILKELHLITSKKQIYLCNVDEASLSTENSYVKTVREIAQRENAAVEVICGKLEADIADLSTVEEKQEFLQAVGLAESGLDKLIQTAYRLLNLSTFFTAGSDEARAWTFHNGDKAPQAAGVIHSDFERGFIKAEVYHCQDLFDLGSEQAVKAAGKLRIEGKDYLVNDGDVMFFRFNV